MTRSRAAAKVTEPAAKTTKIVTAAAKARAVSTVTASTRSTAAKRKTRSDEDGADGANSEQLSNAKRPARGRPRKAALAEEETPVTASAKPTRGRLSKTIATPTPKEEPVPVRGTRGRPKKPVASKAEEQVPEETAPKTTRSRAGTTTKLRSVAASKPTAKKTVKFQEPDKENLEPLVKAKEPSSAGLRGRPVRRVTATGTRNTKTVSKATDDVEKKPLSPKKVTQVPVSRERDDSEDELAIEGNAPFLALMKSPIKPANIAIRDRQPEPDDIEEEEESTAVINAAILNPPELTMSALTSPARRPPASPFKDTLKSPARKMGTVPLPGSTVKLSNSSTGQPGSSSPFKASLLQSAAKRPQSPIKGINFGSVTKPQHTQSAMKMSMFQSPAKRAIPGFKPLTEPRRMQDFNDSPLSKPITIATTTLATASRPSEKLMLEDEPENNDEAIFSESIEDLEFPGRLSAILPRHADPALQTDAAITTFSPAEVDRRDKPLEGFSMAGGPVELIPAEANSFPQSPMIMIDKELDAAAGELNIPDPVAEPTVSVALATSVFTSIVQPLELETRDTMLQLRETKTRDHDSDDEDNTTMHLYPATPTSVGRHVFKGETNENKQSTTKASRRSTMGFTALTKQLSAWSANSPCKSSQPTTTRTVITIDDSTCGVNTTSPQTNEESAMSARFFDDEMSVRPDGSNNSQIVDAEAPMKNDEGLELNEPFFDDILVTEEDIALAEEATEMSLMEHEQIEDTPTHNHSFDDSLSDASQEYGDENQVPVDPAMLGPSNQVPTTPVRPVMTSFHTTTKVPLKPADESSPSPLKKRSFSASRVAPKRPSTLSRSATVISYSPTKENRRTSVAVQHKHSSSASGPTTTAPATPQKPDIWSTLGTPARTPRRDVDSSLLRGAIVYVDVHTSEGSDASSIFIELLSQMGARCVKVWDWDPNDPLQSNASSAKVGITHVVYKDGAERTLEKVRQANGVVHCVGVSWVLE
jgi:hypothetical protein